MSWAGSLQQAGESQDTLKGLEVLWRGLAEQPQVLLSAGKRATSPCASAAERSKMVGQYKKHI